MATTVRFHHGLSFCTTTESGKLLCEPDEGKEYPSAPELLMASLGSCIGSVIMYFADRHRIDYQGMEIDLDWEIAEHPHRIGEIRVQVRMPAKLTEEQQETLERVAHQCLIHNTFTHPPQIELTLEGKPA